MTPNPEAGVQSDPALITAAAAVLAILAICCAIALWPELRRHVAMWHQRRRGRVNG